MNTRSFITVLLVVCGCYGSAWGYRGDVFSGDDNYIYRQRHFEDTEMEPVLSQLHSLVSIAAVGTVVYWADRTDKTIYRVDTQGNAAPEPLLVTLYTPYQLKVDPVARKLYWLEDESIVRANDDGTEVEPIIAIEGYTDDFAVSPGGENVFWVDLMTGNILSADMDGSNIQNITPNGLPEFDPFGGYSTVAASRDHLYFACGGYSYGRPIYRIPVGGGTLETISQGSGEFIIKLFFHEIEDTLYWSFGPSLYGGIGIRSSFGPVTDVDGIQILEDMNFCVSWGEDRPLLWWTDMNWIYKKSLSYVKRLAVVTDSLTSIESDFTEEAVGGWIYWSEMGGGDTLGTGAVYRVSADGTQRETVMSDLNSVSDILIDPEHGHLYWADFLTGTINRAIPGSKNIETIVEDAGLPLDIVYDSGNNTLYWSDYYSGIWSFNLTTLSKSHIKNMSNVETPLALDAAAQTLYFIDAYYTLQKIKTDGSNEENMLIHYDGHANIIYDANGSSLYWLHRGLLRVRLGATPTQERFGTLRGYWLALDIRTPTITLLGRPTAYVGSSVTLRTGVLPPLLGQVTYEWYKDSVLIENADTPSLVINSVTMEDAGVYHLIIRDESKGQYTSNPFVLTVLEGSLPIGRVSVLVGAAMILAIFARFAKRHVPSKKTASWN